MVTLFDEFIAVLGNDTFIYDDESSKELVHKMCTSFPFTTWARIDWDAVVEQQDVENIDLVPSLLGEKLCYVIWGDGSIPVIKANIQSIVDHIDDAIIVSFDMRLCDLNFQKIVEFYHDGETKFGLRNKDS